jgi:cell fate (sporulation/competence/biofilm development) regulator YlbF (YheA/YmcA/DUF963 family)
MSAVTEMASRLGKTIAQTPEAQAMKDARKKLEEDAEIKQALEEFQQQMQKIQQLQQEHKPIEPEDKQKLSSLESKLAGSDTFKQYTAAQVNFYDLMRKVNRALQAEIGDLEGSES